LLEKASGNRSHASPVSLKEKFKRGFVTGTSGGR